ncbi:MAG: hypothetical protein P8X75_14705 [Limibacillus sp.]
MADFLTPNGEMGLAAHYRGTRGCKVTLFLVPNAETLQESSLQDSSLLGEELTRTGEGTVLSYGWRHGAIGYLLLAEGMDEGRLGLIAEKLYEASRGIEILDQKARQQLAENRRRSAPCHA